MNPAKRLEIFTRFRAANPHPTTELEFTTPFELLIAVLLSAQSTDVGVNKAMRRLFPVANTPQAILDLGIDELKTYISIIGLYNTKAKNVMATCQILVDQYGGEVPPVREALESLPGVGRKTANVVLTNAYKIPSGVIVDTHVARVSRRMGLSRQDQPERIEAELMRAIPQDEWIAFGPAMVLHGRYVCTAKKPKCDECRFAANCEKRDVE